MVDIKMLFLALEEPHIINYISLGTINTSPHGLRPPRPNQYSTHESEADKITWKGLKESLIKRFDT